MKSAKTTVRVIEALAQQHPNADTELHYRNPFELLVATILSAQSTDVRVNMVTPALFKRFPDARALAKAPPRELEALIRSTGFFNQKGKALIGAAQQLVAEHEGEVPADMELLTKLPGVGRKTANVVLGHALGVPGLPVDRHVLRVSNRIGLAEGEDPVKVEQQLCALLPPPMWTLASDVQILHGRRICKPKPLCDQCAVRDDCDYYNHVMVNERRSGPSGPTRRGGPSGPTRRGGPSGPPAKPKRRGGPSGPRATDDARKVRTTRR
jgi:endonuclease III